MADKLMDIKVISPDRIFYQGKVEFVEFNTIEGIMGIYPRHIPTTTIISPGILKLRNATEEKVAALHSGFVEVLENYIVIIAESVEWPEEIDKNRAKEAQVRAERRIKEKGLDEKRAELALKRSITRQKLTK